MKLRWIALILLTVIYLWPVYWMVEGSFQSAKVVQRRPPALFPVNPTLENYEKVFRAESPIHIWLGNTILITVATVVIALVVNGMAAYAFAMFKFPGKRVLFIAFLATLMISRYSLLIPTFVMLKWYHLSGQLAVILSGVFYAEGIYLANVYIKTIPASLIEIARMDGAHETTILFRIVAPLCKPLIACLLVFKGIDTMANYIWQMLLLFDEKRLTLIVGLYKMINKLFMTQHLIDYGLQNAIGVLMFIPLLTIFLLARRYFMTGLTMGSVKE